MSSYAVRYIALDAVFDKTEVSPPGQAVPDIGIQYLPAGAAGTVDLYIGTAGDPIPLYLMGQSLHSNPAENTGIYIRNRVAAPGQVLILIIGYVVSAQQAY